MSKATTMIVRNKRELLAAYMAAAGEFDSVIELHRKDGGVTTYKTNRNADPQYVKNVLRKIARTPAEVLE